MTNSTRRSTRSLLTVAAALTLSVPLAACGDTDEPTDQPAVTGGAQDETEPGDAGNDAGTQGTTDDTGASPSGSQDALATAVSSAEDEAGGTAFEIDLEDDGEWEVSVAVGEEEVQVRVSADGSEVLDSRSDGTLDRDELAALEVATVPITEAVATALGEVGGTFDDADLDDDGGTVSWTVTIDRDGDDDVEVYVDIASGEILEIEND